MRWSGHRWFRDPDARLRTRRVRGYFWFWLLEIGAGLWVVIAGVYAVARLFGARDVGLPIAFDWSRRLNEVVDAAVTLRADDWGGHGSITVVDAPAWLAVAGGLLVFIAAVCVFVTLQHVRLIFIEVDRRERLAEVLGIRLGAAGRVTLVGAFAWATRDLIASQWVASQVPGALGDIVTLRKAISPHAYSVIVLGLFLLLIAGFIRQVISDDLYADESVADSDAGIS